MSNTMRELKIDEIESVSGGYPMLPPQKVDLSGLVPKGYVETLGPNGWYWSNTY